MFCFGTPALHSSVFSLYLPPILPPSNCVCVGAGLTMTAAGRIYAFVLYFVRWWAWMIAWLSKCLCLYGEITTLFCTALYHFLYLCDLSHRVSMCHFVCTPCYQEEWFGDSVSPHLQCSYCIMVTTVTLSRNASLTTVGWRRVFFFFQQWGFPWIFQNRMLYHCQQCSVALLQKLLFKDKENS